MELSAGPMYYKEEMENNLIPGRFRSKKQQLRRWKT